MTDVNRIDFRVDADESPDWPCVTVLVDGEDVLGRATGFKGFDPEDLFAADGPLQPKSPPRRVAVYRCSCGEPGCGCAACVISESDGVIRWGDFRDFVGVYSKPTVEPDPTGGSRYSVPDLAFDAVQYREALGCAADDRSWETKRRRLARLLRARLLSGEEELAGRGYELGWVAPEWNREEGLNVELRVPNGQVVLRLDADFRLPEAMALDQLVSAVLDVPEDRWHVLHRNHWQTDDG